MKCIIIDDEPLAIKVIAKHITLIDNLDLMGTFENPIDGFNYLQSNEVDLIFLDIQMPKITGLVLLKSLKKRPFVILCTAYREYALDGFDLDVLDYLLKPISFDRFLEAVDKLFQRTKKVLVNNYPESARLPTVQKETFVFVRSEKENVKINLDDILYVESLKNHVRVMCKVGSIITLIQISQMEEKLPPQNFVRIHRSFIVSLNKVDRYTSANVTIGEKLLPIGRIYKQGVLVRLEEHLI